MNRDGFLAPVHINTNVITLERCFFPSFFPKSASVGETARTVSPVVILSSLNGSKMPNSSNSKVTPVITKAVGVTEIIAHQLRLVFVCMFLIHCNSEGSQGG